MTQDYAVGYEATRRIMAVGEARGYEPATSQMRNIAAMFCVPWFEPVEEVVRQLQQAREVLLRYGELQYAAFTYVNIVPAMLDSAPTLDVSAAEVAAGLTFTAGIGDEFIAAPLECYQQLLRCLRGETDPPGSFDDGSFTETAHLDQVSADPMGTFNFHCYRSLAAAVFGDVRSLATHTAAAMPLLPHVPGM